VELRQHDRFVGVATAPRHRQQQDGGLEVRVAPAINPALLDPIPHVAHVFDCTERVRHSVDGAPMAALDAGLDGPFRAPDVLAEAAALAAIVGRCQFGLEPSDFLARLARDLGVGLEHARIDDARAEVMLRNAHAYDSSSPLCRDRSGLAPRSGGTARALGPAG
jgi:hypothetical protein